MAPTAGDVEMANTAEGSGEDDKSEHSDLGIGERKPHETHAPFFVFVWTSKPWHMWGHLTPLFLTHAGIACALGVFACNYGMYELACSWLGLLGFVSCIMACSKIQSYASLKGAAEQMEEELDRMKKLMSRYENENEMLKETLQAL